MDLYMEFINEIAKMLPIINISNNIVSAYIGGSVSRGDYVVDASDIDIYIVVNEDEGTSIASINSFIQDIAKEKLSQLLSWCPDGVNVSFTTYGDIKSGTSWLGNGSEYYSFKDTGKLIYGKDIKQEIVEPNKNDIYKMSRQAISQLKQIVQQDLAEIDFNRQNVRDIFSTVFSAMHFYLCLHNIYIRGKEKTINEFSKTNSTYSSMAKEVFKIWNAFSQRQLNKAEIDNLIYFTKVIVNNV